MEAVFAAFIGAGLEGNLFWASTPYDTSLRLRAVHRDRAQGSLLAGWFAERFAREQQLRGPAAYAAEMLDGETNPEMAEAMAEAELSRMALEWGLELQDLSDEVEGV